MSVKFFNIRSKEVLVADSEEKISALWSSSDRSPNITQGQDFGWRLAPEVVVEMKRIKQDLQMLERIAHTYNRPLEDVGEPEILQYISAKTDERDAPVAQDGDYTDEYESEIRRLELEQQNHAAINPAPTAAPAQESLEDLEKRVALEERLAAARAANAAPTNTTETATTTSVTTEAPTTTTTTTEAPTTTTTTTETPRKAKQQ